MFSPRMTIRRNVENCQLLIDEKLQPMEKECPRILLQLRRLKALEARVGIEPTHKGFADLSLTTWVPRPSLLDDSNGERCAA
jgi:hypothetical protein